ncbi:ATP-binding protein [Candidatus Thiodictyon syntrophicum]|jgi:signal transduction histidine kinase/CheY-like chemotaxis protein|uniref:histidine kinase n=1 Tax=Candidatus Thiodictyon syntrophicum TaxID=1166950 RepID=A0A2K8UF60_9GAMM|nr:ATP-binding protein [Candidatus Thiodictyon syntrophicum]AUB84218.1 hypothetical protein THSYN_26955 [Candidatus Thiodictyon syntrophicum]
MSQRRRTTFRRYNLLLEVAALGLTSAILVAAVWFTLAEMNRNYLDLRLADAARVQVFLEGQLDDARASLARLADLPEAERSPSVLKLFADFSDIYSLDQQLRVERIYKSVPDTKVFPGFSFSGGKLGGYLRSVGEGTDASEIMRGHEDDAPSVYFAIRPGGRLYLGRLNLAYVQDFLTQFSQFSGTPLMLVASDGFVMLSGDPGLNLAMFDLRKWAGPPTARRTLLVGNRRWIPMIAPGSAIGARILILIPTQLLDTQRNTLLAFLGAFLGGLILLVVIKNRRFNRLVIQPIAAFAERMRDLELGRLAVHDGDADYRFEELADIHTRFRAMAQAITQREQSLRESEQNYRIAKEEAEEANRAKSTFLANMSHEIRTPLNAILGFTQVLVRDPDLNSSQSAALTTIQRSGEHLLTLINDILDMAKIEAGRMTQQLAPFDLPRLVTDLDALFARRARDQGLTLIVAASALPRTVLGDELKLRQVLINLVGNAVKFTASGAVTLRVAPLTGDAVRFCVIDSGEGIAPEDMPRLFEPFSQIASGRQTQKGTGLGLALSRQILRLMGAELSADSTPGQGSCFSFTLSLPPGDPGAPTTARTERLVVGLEPGQPLCRVLIVDDLPDNRAPLRALLTALNPQPPVLDVREAADGREAVAVWNQWQPHVIFMDMRMPLLSGEEATRQIKALMAAHPAAVRTVIVALTASAFNEDRDQFLACGCDEFACKPFLAAELFAILERRVGLRFIRAAQRPVPEPPLSPAAVAWRLAACPGGWRSDLKAAIEQGDFIRITELVEQVQEQDAALGKVLVKWAYDFDLDAFTRALSGEGPDPALIEG